MACPLKTSSRPSWTTHASNDVVLKEYWDLLERLPWQNKTSSHFWFPVDGFTNGNTIITAKENTQEHGWLWFATYGPWLWKIFWLPLLRLNSVPLHTASITVYTQRSKWHRPGQQNAAVVSHLSLSENRLPKNILGIQSCFSRLKIVILGHSRHSAHSNFQTHPGSCGKSNPNQAREDGIGLGLQQATWFVADIPMIFSFNWYDYTPKFDSPWLIFPRRLSMMDNPPQPVNVTYFSFMTRTILLRAATNFSPGILQGALVQR